MKKECTVFLDNKPFSFEVLGDFFWGKDEVLYKEEDNIISKVNWTHEGYGVVDIFSEKEYLSLKNSIKKNILKAAAESGIEVDPKVFKLENYHQFFNTDELQHKIISITKNLQLLDVDVDLELIANRLGEYLGYRLKTIVPVLKKSHVQVRISRPKSLDINPPHKDGYLSYWRDIINVWVPIVGCTKNSSLPVLPKSHLIKESHILRTKSKGAQINGNTYYVPCILEVKDMKMKMVRPNPKIKQALLITPFLIYGAAYNGNKAKTRISLELRFPKA